MAENDNNDNVETVNTDLHADDSPFNQDGFVGVDPYFQVGEVIEPKGEKTDEKSTTEKSTTEKSTDEKSTTEKAPSQPTPVTPPASSTK